MPTRERLGDSFWFLTALVTALLASPLAPAADDPIVERRAAMLAIAERYAGFEWQASEANVFHDDDPRGVRVETPDANFHKDGWKPDGSVNVGVPYAWGGFSSLEEFEQGVAQGLYAGNIPRSERAGSSDQALGVDCSGFVARCWDLPIKQSTRSLGALCYELESYAQLEPGDILNKYDNHVVLFKEWVDRDQTAMWVYESGRLKVEQNRYTVAQKQREGYVAMRYKPLDDRWVDLEDQTTQFSVAGSDARGEFVPDADGQPREIDELENPLAGDRPLEWARYSLRGNSADAASPSVTTRMIGRVEEDDLSIQDVTEINGRPLMTGGTVDVSDDFADALLQFASFSQPLDYMTVSESAAIPGIFKLGGREFKAFKITASLEGFITIRHKAFPVTLKVECMQSDEVPLQGILEASFTLEIVWNEAGEDRTVSQARRELSLLEFGGLN